MTLSRKHFNAITYHLKQARATLIMTGVSPTGLTTFDTSCAGIADQLASAAGTFDKARFIAEVRGEHVTRKVTFKEPSNV